MLDTLASLEQQVKALRAAISTEVLNARDTVRTASMTAPTRLTAQPNGFTGQLIAKWSNVASKRFYEVQAAPLEGTASPVLHDSLATETSTRSQIELKGYVPGSLLSIRVRAVGSKGPGPWCDPITARV